ncbi:NAD(P)-dependent alcohol dehydrogenase [Leifsonia kafniensis]|uniref:NAD(P)-dependent alcohol dehydrogenase n=1 Tax=Leifsonia kafniensis TaxID=475957 RepID=A0ABP7K1C4_9MICO
MRAAVHTKYGGPEVLRVENVDKPSPRPGELLIKVVAASVNRTDRGFLRGKPLLVRLFSGVGKPKQQTLGNEFAGRVEAVGEGVTEFAVGQDVFGYDGYTFGGQAEYTTIRATGMVALIPAGMTYAEVVPSTEGAHYALNIIRAAGIFAGQNVLIYGATGAIGSAAVQLVKHLGARVTAVCGTPHLALVASLGADRVVDYTREDFTQLDEQFDAVLDAVGKSSFGACKALLAPRGVYVSTELGRGWQNPLLAIRTSMFGRKKVLFPIPKDTREDLNFLKWLMEIGAFRPVIDRTFSLDEIAAAYRYVESGVKVGNVVIRVAEEG